MKTTLPPKTEPCAEHLQNIVDSIRESVEEDLAMIILFGSYARGDWSDTFVQTESWLLHYQSDIDILVLMANEKWDIPVKGDALESIIDRRLGRQGLSGDPHAPPVQLIVQSIQHVNKRLERGHYFFSDINKEGVMLYDSGEFTLAERRVLGAKELQRCAQEEYDYWFGSAGEFLEQFDHAVQKGFNALAAFELHQATERCYAAIWLVFWDYKPKTHDLEKLAKRAESFDPRFATAFPQTTDEEKRLYKLLLKAYIDARCKPSYKITREELEYLGGRVRILHSLTEQLCLEKIDDLFPEGQSED